MIETASPKDFSGSRWGSGGHGCGFVDRSGSRSFSAIAIATSSFATAGRFATASVTATGTAALRGLVQLDLDTEAAEIIKEVKDWGAARLAARLAARGLAAASRFTSFFAAINRFAASFFATSGLAATIALLAFKQTLQASEQIALGLAARIAARGLATFFFATGGRFATLDLFATSGFTTATLGLAKQIVQKFKTKPLANQDNAQ